MVGKKKEVKYFLKNFQTLILPWKKRKKKKEESNLFLIITLFMSPNVLYIFLSSLFAIYTPYMTC